MKKIFSLFLVLMLALSLLCGCAPDVPTETTVPPTTISEFVPSPEYSDLLHIETEDFIYTITGVIHDDTFGCYSVEMYIENKTEYELTFSWENVSISDYMIDPFFGCSVPAGKKMNTSTAFYDTLLEENNITDFNNVEFALSVYYFTDPENWEGHTILCQDTYKIEF